MGALSCRVKSNPPDNEIKAHRINPNDKVDEAVAARRVKDFITASRLYEEAAAASIQVKDPPGITASYYVEAANCTESAYESNKFAGAQVYKTKCSRSQSRNYGQSATSVSQGSTCSRDSKKGEMSRMMKLLEQGAQQFVNAKRNHQAADIYKRMAMLYHDELDDRKSALKFYEQASIDYEAAHFFNNAIDCDLQRANISLKVDPLKSLDIYKMAVKKLVQKQQITTARPLIYKIVLLTGSLYDYQTAKMTSDTYIAMNRTFQSSVDLRKLRDFLDALEEEDNEVVDDIIDETGDPWAKEMLVKIKNDAAGSVVDLK